MATCAKWKVPIVITSLGALVEVNQGGACLGRDHAARHHQRPLRAQGDREGRRRHHRGRRGRRRPCRAALALRADPGDTRLVRRAADPVGRDRHRPRDPRRAGDGRGSRLYRLALHRHRRRPMRPTDYKQGIVEGRADDIVYSSLFTGVHGNYLQRLDRQLPGSTRPTCPKATSARWTSAPATAPRPRPGATSGARARASARSTRCCRRAIMSRG